MNLVDTKAEAHYRAKISGWKELQEPFTERNSSKKKTLYRNGAKQGLGEAI